MESVHNLTWSSTTLHTRANCDQSKINTGLDFSGTGWGTGTQGQAAKNCFVSAANEYSNSGCGQKMPTGSFGAPLNEGGGGTWAADWDPDEHHIRTWFFKAGQEPLDLQQKQPRPEFWGTPTSYFTLDRAFCSKGHFKNMRIVFDTTFCGDYGAATFSSACPQAGMSCDQFVRTRPRDFSEAYWSIKDLDVYQRANYEKYHCDADMGAAAPIATGMGGSSGGMNWLLAGFIFTGLGVFGIWAVRAWPRQALRKTRGLVADTGNAAGDALAQCLDVNVEQLHQGELAVGPPKYEGRNDHQQLYQVPARHQVQPQAPPVQNNPFAYFLSPTTSQPQAMRSQSMEYIKPPSPARGSQPAGYFSNWTTAGQPMGGQPAVSRTTSPSYLPPPGSRHTRNSSGGWGFLAAVPGLGGAYDSARQPASPVTSMNSGSYSLPPTINALGSGHLPPQYQPVRGYDMSGR